ncbi:hypothetical protein SE18_18825 [Herpetosiphon geysericola]|uniref:DUF2723 domain-containing protein n=1 Tax=Herpetosiphon geysericola TaxID=70996 RepID=A0A0P6YIM4_9CHLR|nr:hypothetical protein SE18_18825 [Herpetosiphon geysericola]
MMQNPKPIKFDRNVSALLLFGVALLLYNLTLLPGLGGGDTAEFQRVGPTLEIAHSTGYPLYSIVTWLWSKVLPFGSVAWRINLFSAFAAALSLTIVAQIALKLGLAQGWAWACAAILGLSATFWQQATHAEIYAFAVLLQVGTIWLILAWRQQQVAFCWLGLAAGLMLGHHRSSLFLLPWMLIAACWQQRPTGRQILLAIAAGLISFVPYLYIVWRAPVWQNGWAVLTEYLLGSAGGAWFDPQRAASQAWQRFVAVQGELFGPQLTWLGFGLACYGFWQCWRQQRPIAIMLAGSYCSILGFCLAYFVDDLAVFGLGAYVMQALLIGFGLAYLPWPRWSLAGALAISVWLAWQNLPHIQASNTAEIERLARQRLAEPIAAQSLVIGDGWSIESLRYLQAVEQQRPDLEFSFQADQQRIRDQLARGRQVYALQAIPELALQHRKLGDWWQIENKPLQFSQQLSVGWQNGIQLTGLELPSHAQNQLLVALRWQTAQPLPSLIRFIHVLDQAGNLVAQTDSPTNPTSQTWALDQAQSDLLAVDLAAPLPAGRYTVIVGWYDLSGQRMQLEAGNDTYELGQIVID